MAISYKRTRDNFTSTFWRQLKRSACLFSPNYSDAAPMSANRQLGIRPTDPLSFALAIATMIAVAMVADYFPARRAAGTDPMIALRCQ